MYCLTSQAIFKSDTCMYAFAISMSAASVFLPPLRSLLARGAQRCVASLPPSPAAAAGVGAEGQALQTLCTHQSQQTLEPHRFANPLPCCRGISFTAQRLSAPAERILAPSKPPSRRKMAPCRPHGVEERLQLRQRHGLRAGCRRPS